MVCKMDDRASVESKVTQIFEDLFDVDPGAVKPDSSPDDIEKWDSLGHVNLMAALEDAFGLVVPPEDQIEMLTFELVCDVICERLNIA